MKYPFADTPMNRKLASLIDQCAGPSMIITSEVGKYIFHAIPNASIIEVKKADGWDVDIAYNSVHIAVIDKEEGTFGLGQFRDHHSFKNGPTTESIDIKSLLKAIEVKDIQEIYKLTPIIVNLDMGRPDDLTYLDHYQHLHSKNDTQRFAYELNIQWLVENGHKKAGSIEAPKAIEDAVIDIVKFWGGRKTKEGDPASGSRLLTRYSSYESIPKIMNKEFKVDSLVRVKGYVRSNEIHSVNQDLGNTLGNSANPYGLPEVALNTPLDTYYEDSDDMYASINEAYYNSTLLFKDRIIESYKDALFDKYSMLKASMSKSEIHSLVDRIGDMLDKDTSLATSLIGESPQASRNKAQMLDFFDGNGSIFSAFMSDERVKMGIAEGRPLKETLGHLPLLNTSKRTINAYLNNFKNYLSYQGEPVELTTEKGTSHLNKSNPIVTSSIGKNLHEAIALMTTLPETHLIGDDRSADTMMKVLAGFPNLIETLSRRCIDAREGRSSIQNLMSWVPGELDNIEKRPRTVRDAEFIFKDNYYSTVVHHLKNLHNLDVGDDPYAVNEQPVILKGRGIIDSLSGGGEYRNILSFDDEIHRDIHQLLKLGKPDADIEWERTIDEDFEFNGYRINPITNNADLSQEGIELNHCVGTYLSAILANESYIFSVTKDGTRVSTIEINESFGGEEDFQIVQHYAYENSKPPQEAIEVAEEFLEAINEEDIVFNRSPCERDSIDEYFDEGMEVERQEVEFGLRFSDRDFVLHTINSMNRILPSFDVWEALEKEKIPGSKIDDLRRDFEIAYGAERSLESA